MSRNDGDGMTKGQVLLHNGKQLFISLDQTLNALAGTVLALLWCLWLWPRRVGLWWADETISAHCWRWERNGIRSWPRRIVDAVFFLDPRHCRESYESERLGRQLPPELRSGSSI